VRPMQAEMAISKKDANTSPKGKFFTEVQFLKAIPNLLTTMALSFMHEV